MGPWTRQCLSRCGRGRTGTGTVVVADDARPDPRRLGQPRESINSYSRRYLNTIQRLSSSVKIALMHHVRTEARSPKAAKDALFAALAGAAKALGNGRRAEIVDLLAQSERSVQELATEMGQSVANTSQHLQVLVGAGLVTGRALGTKVIYSLVSDDVLQFWLHAREVAARQVDAVPELTRAYVGERSELVSITPAELEAMKAAGAVVVLDVRPEPEFLAGHLPGAISLPPAALGHGLGDLPLAETYVAYCRGPYCRYADEAVRELLATGRRAVRLEVDLPEWRLAGGAVAVGPEPAAAAG